MSSPPPIDPVTIAVAVGTALFGSELASVIGPYAVITLSALLGGAWSASRREPGRSSGVLLHMLLMVGWALLIALPLAWLAGKHLGLDDKWLLGPVAVLIAGVGQDWPDVGRWAVAQARGLAERWVGRRDGGQP